MATSATILNAETEFGGEPTASPSLQRMVHGSETMRDITRLIRKVAPTAASVLLVGESGTGKELGARTVHELSDRREGPFVALDCGAIPETLIEGELFGHEKGAYTGASHRRAGYFEMAHGGTLFLDELVSMPIASQTKLLRALEEKSFRRLGGKEELRVDTRLIAAMNEDPAKAIQDGRLREDLYYRINVITIQLPPLRERIEDIPPLVEKFVREYSGASRRSVRGVDRAAMRLLMSYRWPGNIRELRNVIERAVILAEGSQITVDELPKRLLSGGEGTASVVSASATEDAVAAPETTVELPAARRSLVGMTLDELTRRLLLDTLDATGYNKARTARMLGVSTKTVYNKLKEWSTAGDAEALLANSRCQERRSDAPIVRGRVVPLDGRRAAGSQA